MDQRDQRKHGDDSEQAGCQQLGGQRVTRGNTATTVNKPVVSSSEDSASSSSEDRSCNKCSITNTTALICKSAKCNEG